MNRPIVTLPHQSGEPAAYTPPARPPDAPTDEPDAGIATPSATSVGAPANQAAMLDVAAALGDPPATDPAPGSPVAETAATIPRSPIGPVQVMCWQLAVVVVAVALRVRVGPVGTIATVAGALALVAAAVTFSIAARLSRGASSTRRQDPVLRVAAASPGALDLAVTDLGQAAGAYRVQPERLDGRHGPATAASLPIGRSLI